MSEKDSAESTSTRVTGVSAKILSLLNSGTKSTAELIAEGGFSSAGAFLNLKKLKDQGLVETERAGRNVMYRLADAAAAVAIDDAPRRGRKKGSKNKAAAAPAKTAGKRGPKAKAPESEVGSLRGELAAIAARFAPVDDLKRKLDVLDQLAQSMPREVASVLKAIKGDLSR
ncbi:MAG: helix-turn-helix domain-containing protein [Gammaproteobacteria bacterium]|nr:helix-turn-helix domain-containing protein [Gammaproteobacteria bacterium]